MTPGVIGAVAFAVIAVSGCAVADAIDGASPVLVRGDYVQITAGTFMMGSASPESGRNSDELQHSVTISRDFWLKATEVTQAEWQSVMGSNPSEFDACGASCPVEKVSWLDAVEYLNRLSRAEGFDECYPAGDGSAFVGLSCTGYRLPTEAEWEYAARAGTTTVYWSGAGEADLDRAGWYGVNSGSETHAVAQKVSNAWGLYDVHGNVYEWVHDWYDAYGGGSATDPLGPATGTDRVIRGGSWGNYAQCCRSANRVRNDPGIRRNYFGFRPARSIP